ncbi:hypothetical protein BU14_0086s0015 [Porphyra umbilicalis]|uniref:BZIP domain-containing protein n=1 Tax=Porphyra umbilicalis TaxID=2786 RepID=A0A1X6PE49_PORUM|nr:hypothetical protein BU14_0086s0015 [Porphyra umbilicalis]|eukprot:OSX79128.1 hypothetical protein BU14_0086s0015 [Porphyra umbilicalis]
MCATNDLSLPRGTDVELGELYGMDGGSSSTGGGGYASDGVDALAGWGVTDGCLPLLGGSDDGLVSEAAALGLPFLGGGKAGPPSPTAIATAAAAAVEAAADPFAPLVADEPQAVVVCADQFDVTRLPQYCPLPARVAVPAAGTVSSRRSPVQAAGAPARIPAPVTLAPPPSRSAPLATAAESAPRAASSPRATPTSVPVAAAIVTPAKGATSVKVEDSSLTSRMTPPPSATTALGHTAEGATMRADGDMDGCGAVESARQAAESMALAETEARRKAKKRKRLAAAAAAAGGGVVAPPTAKRRRAAGGAAAAAADDKASVCGAASSDDDGGSDVDVDIPADATSKQVRYLKRLQKNRDSAFTSRIRRRLYTGLLERSLTAVEAEKERLRAKVCMLDTNLHALEAELAVYRAAAAPRAAKAEAGLGIVYEAA